MAGKLASVAQERAAAPEKKSMMDYVKAQEANIRAALPAYITPERFTRIIANAMNTNPELMTCSPRSFICAMMQAAQLGLEPNTPLGQAYLIPYNTKTGRMCQFQLGYRGMIELAYKSGKVASIQAHSVHENDFFHIVFGLEPKLIHTPQVKGERGKTYGFYAILTTTAGQSVFEYMSRDEVEAHAKRYSQAYDNGPWKTAFDEMAKKTVLRRLLKSAPLSAEMKPILEADFAVKDAPVEPDMLDVPNIESEFVEEETPNE